MTMSKQGAKIGHGSNESEGEKRHNVEKRLNQQAEAVEEMMSQLDEKKQNDKKTGGKTKNQKRNRWKYKQQTTQINKKKR